MRVAGLLVGRTLELLRESVHPGHDHPGVGHAGRDPTSAITAAFPTSSWCPWLSAYLVHQASRNNEIVHGIPGQRVLHEGDLLSVDCGAEVAGWNGDAAFTCVVGGRPAAEDLALMDDTEASLWAGIAALKVGDSLYAVGAAVEDSLTASRAATRLREYGIVED